MSHPDHEGLQVAIPEGLEVPYHEAPEVVEERKAVKAQTESNKIVLLKRFVLWCVVILLSVVILAAAVGGGVQGSKSARQSRVRYSLLNFERTRIDSKLLTKPV